MKTSIRHGNRQEGGQLASATAVKPSTGHGISQRELTTNPPALPWWARCIPTSTLNCLSSVIQHSASASVYLDGHAKAQPATQQQQYTKEGVEGACPSPSSTSLSEAPTQESKVCVAAEPADSTEQAKRCSAAKDPSALDEADHGASEGQTMASVVPSNCCAKDGRAAAASAPPVGKVGRSPSKAVSPRPLPLPSEEDNARKAGPLTVPPSLQASVAQDDALTTSLFVPKSRPCGRRPDSPMAKPAGKIEVGQAAGRCTQVPRATPDGENLYGRYTAHTLRQGGDHLKISVGLVGISGGQDASSIRARAPLHERGRRPAPPAQRQPAFVGDYGQPMRAAAETTKVRLSGHGHTAIRRAAAASTGEAKRVGAMEDVPSSARQVGSAEFVVQYREDRRNPALVGWK